MTLKVVQLNKSHFRDPVATLREIANNIEAGDYGQVGTVGVALLGNTFEVFGMGEDSEAPSVALVLHAGFLRLSKALEEHGKSVGC